MKNLLIPILIMPMILALSFNNLKAQPTEIRDDPAARAEYERMIMADPKTGKIPKDIKKKELEYIKSPAANLQNWNKANLRFRKKPIKSNPDRSSGATPTPNAVGDIDQAFTNRGPANVGGRTRAIAIDIADENHLVAGGVSGGIWTSSDQGTTWTRRSGYNLNLSVTDVAQDTRSGHRDTWYYCTGEPKGSTARISGTGVYKSVDNGNSWRLLTNSATFTYAFSMEVDTTNGHLYVASSAGLHRSVDGGTTFQVIIGGDRRYMDIHITANHVFYIVDNNYGIYRSTSGNANSWTNISGTTVSTSNISRGVISSAPSDPNILYVFLAGTSSSLRHDLWKYTYVSGDGSGTGGTWTNRSGNLPGSAVNDPLQTIDAQDGYDMMIRVHPDSPDTVFIGGTSLYRSTDGFATTGNTRQIGGFKLDKTGAYPGHYLDQHALLFFPSDHNKALSSHDGGLSITTNIMENTANAKGETVVWTSLNNGYVTTQAFTVAIGPGNQLLAGFQDSGTFYTSSSSASTSWTRRSFGDGAACAFSDDGIHMYTSAQNNIGIYRFTNNRYTEITPPGSCSGIDCLFVSRFELDPRNDDLLYLIGKTTLFRTNKASTATKAAADWSQLTRIGTGSQLTAIGVSTYPPNVVYVGDRTGKMFKMFNAHEGNPAGIVIYTRGIFIALPYGWINCIEVDPRDADRVLLCYSSYNVQSIWYTSDGGSNWTHVSGNLEENQNGSGDGPAVFWVEMVGPNVDLYLAGTSTGLYATTTLNGANTVWTQVEPNTIGHTAVFQVQSRKTDGLVAVASHGTGLYTGSYEVSPQAIQLDRTLPDVTIIQGNHVDVDITGLFSSLVTPQPLALTVTVHRNYNTTVVPSATITQNTLRLTASSTTGGTGRISLKATDPNGRFLTTAFDITVSPLLTSTITFGALPAKQFGDPAFDLAATSTPTAPITYTSSEASVATISGNTVTIVGVGTTIITAQRAATATHTAASQQQTLTVNKATSTITFGAIPAKRVGDPAFDLAATSTSTAPITYTSSEASVATISGSTVTIVGVGTTTITAQQVATATHTAASQQQTLTVNKATSVITFGVLPAKRPTDPAFDLVATSTSSAPITYTSSNLSVATISGNTVTIVGVGTTTITAQQVATATHTSASASQVLTVTSKIIPTITFGALPVKRFGDPAFDLTATSTTTTPITYTSSEVSVATISGNTVTIVGVGTTTITAQQAATATHAVASQQQTLTVNKAVSTITFGALPAKQFGDPAFDLTATSTTTTPITYTSSEVSVATISGSTVTIVGVGTTIITAQQAETATHAAASQQQTLTVNKATSVITFGVLPAKRPTDPAFDLVATSTSSAPITYTSSNLSVATISGSTVTIVGVGTTTITAQQVATATHTAASASQVLTVTSKIIPTITFGALPVKQFGDPAFDLAATSTITTTPITYTSSEVSVATISGSTVTIVGVGTTTIMAQQAETATHAAASQQQTLTVNKATSTITFETLPAKRVGDPAFDLTATSTSTAPITYTSSEVSVATISGSTVTIVGVGTTNITAQQAENDHYLSASLSRQLVVNEVSGIMVAGVKGRLTLYPNPAEGKLSVSLDGFEQDIVELTIVDMKGNIVKSFQGHGQDVVTVNVNDLSHGKYVVSGAQRSIIYSAQFVKE